MIAAPAWQVARLMYRHNYRIIQRSDKATLMPDPAFHARAAMLPDGWAEQVRITVRDGLFATIERDRPAEPDDERHAAILPGLPNLHSHAFQRAMAGLAEARGSSDDDFWSWRAAMYRFVDRIGPEELRAIALMAQIEMLESGFTRVGEFHYLHHDRAGGRFADPAEMSASVIAAAEESGIALTHLPVFYAHAGFGGIAPAAEQRRFVHDVDGFADLLEAVRGAAVRLPDAVVGIAPHSLRAVTPEELAAITPLAGHAPIHIHIAEQTREVDDCMAWAGARPVEWLLDHAAVDARWCLVHATHVTARETAAIVGSGSVVGLCPITEANLGDGIFPAARFLELGGRFGVGSDSNVLIDATEELRLLEYGQRLSLGQRNVVGGGRACSTGDALYRHALAGGGQALGAGGVGIAVGEPADFLSLDTDHASLLGRSGAHLVDGLIFAAGRSAIDGVWRRGRRLVSDGRHHARDRAMHGYRRALAELLA